MHALRNRFKNTGKCIKKTIPEYDELRPEDSLQFLICTEKGEGKCRRVLRNKYKWGGIIGTGISCGIDSLSTIYNRFVAEQDPDYRITGLFLFNCGTHGDYEEAGTREKYLARYEQNSTAAMEMDLPIYLVDSNLHAFTHRISEQKVGYFAIESCILSLQKAISKYYISGTYEYGQIMEFGKQSHDFDMAEFSDSYLIPLIQTEQMELILEGAQYTRSEKTQLISGWDIAKKHLNVCVAKTADTANCSKCSKCMRTMIPLDALGKLEDFADVFDLEVYCKKAYVNKLKISALYQKEGFATDNVDFARKNGLKMPSLIEVLLFKTVWSLKRNIRRLLGKS